jgi:hypothetical protein
MRLLWYGYKGNQYSKCVEFMASCILNRVFDIEHFVIRFFVGVGIFPLSLLADRTPDTSISNDHTLSDHFFVFNDAISIETM